MNAVLGHQELKTFSRIIKFMAKIGDDGIYFQPNKDCLELKSVNSSKTSYCCASLEMDFFLKYELGDPDENGERSGRIPFRPILHVLRNVKSVLNCQLKLEPAKDRLIFEMSKPKDLKFQTNIVMNEHVELETINPVKAPFNTIICEPRILNNLLINFPSKLCDLALVITKTKFEIRNHINHPDKDVQTVRLNYQLDPAEFITYDVEDDHRLIVLAKDFLALVDMAETSGREIKMIFTKNTRPLEITVESESSVKINFVMATMREDALNSMRQAPVQTSYRDVMNSYIEGRKSMKAETSMSRDKTANRFSDTEFQRVMSPQIASFGTSKGRIPIKDESEKSKRKSIDMLSSDQVDNGTFRAVDNASKKLKKNLVLSQDDVPSPVISISHQSSQNLSQREQQEVSQLILDLEDFDDDEDEDLFMQQAIEPPQPVGPPKALIKKSFLDGLEGIKVDMKRRKTVSMAESDFSSEGSARLDVSKARFDTEEIIPDANNQPRADLIKEQAIENKKTTYYAKKLFAAVLKPKPESILTPLADCSDSESSENSCGMDIF